MIDHVPFAIVGAGPAGLAAAYELAKAGRQAVVFEQGSQVGGLAKTVNFEGFRCDVGGHRFFTKNEEVNQLWRDVLAEGFIKRPRLSRIFYRGKLFHYPLKPLNAMMGLGLLTSLRVIASFLARRIRPKKPELTFEDWVSNRFGHALYSIFFKTYTEKVWGISCTELSADWAAQRIRNLSLGRAIANALWAGRTKKVASLIHEFDYPRYGPGQMYETMAELVAKMGGAVHTHSKVAGVLHDGRRATALRVEHDGNVAEVSADHVVSTMPLTDLACQLDPPPPPEVLDAARSLRYRTIITVNLVVRAEHVLPDNWVYLHAPEVQACRLQLYKNWSPAMVPDPAMNTLGFEYFTFEDSDFWNRTDEQLVEIARSDLAGLGLGMDLPVEKAFVARHPKAYPMYEEGYRDRVAIIRRYLEQFENLVCAGRYGQFRYNNMDHSIYSAMLAVRRLLGNDVDPWSVNEEAEYHEEKAGS